MTMRCAVTQRQGMYIRRSPGLWETSPSGSFKDAMAMCHSRGGLEGRDVGDFRDKC